MHQKKHNAAREAVPGAAGTWHRSRAAQRSAAAETAARRKRYRQPGKSAVAPGSYAGSLEKIFADLPVGVAYLDRNFHYLRVNPAYASAVDQALELNGSMKPEKLSGKNHFDLFPDNVLQSFFQQVLATGQPYQAFNETLPFLQSSRQQVTYWNWYLLPLRAGDPESGGAVHGLIFTISPASLTEQTSQTGETQALADEVHTRASEVHELANAIIERARFARSESESVRHDAREARSSSGSLRANVQQTQLRHTQIMYQHLFESSADANVMVNGENVIVAVNGQAVNLFGYSRAEMEGQSVDMLVPDINREVHSKLRREYMQHPVPRTMAAAQTLLMELYGRRKDGSVFPTEITLNPIKVGGTQFVLCVVRDISQRVQHERELRTQSELVRLLQDIAVAANEANSLPRALAYALERVNRQLGWLLGHAYLADEDGALSTTHIWTGEVSDRFAIFKAVSEAMRFRAGSGLPGTVLITSQPAWQNRLPENPQFARRREAQQAELLTGLAIPIKTGSEVVGLLEFFHEKDIPPDPNLLAVLPHIGLQLGRVVERYRSEQTLRKSAAQLRMVMTNLPVILWVVDRQGRFVLFEGKGAAEMQIKPEALLGKNVFEQLDTRPDVLKNIRRALAGEELHTEIPSSSGAVYETYLTPYYDENWTVDGMIGMSMDISERKRMEAELEEMKHRLIDSMDGERARLARRLHDGPLQDLFGAFYQIQEIKGSLDDHGQEITGRALQTIQGVNATLRVICGELHPNTLVHLGLEKAIRSHADRLQDRLIEKKENTLIHLDLQSDSQSAKATPGIGATQGVAKTLPETVRLGIYRIYLQLITNAVEHAAAPDIWVRLRQENGQVVLEIEDNGKGFESPGHWIDLVRQGKLGLVSAQERIEGLNGRLAIDTRPGTGTKIRVIVPIQ